MKLNMKNKLVVLIFFFANSLFAQTDTLSIFFEFGAEKLTLKQKTLILGFVEGLDNTLDYDIRLIGWTDKTGDKEKNIALSLKRASNVYSFILSSSNLSDFSTIRYIGNGEMEGDSSPNIKRQVMMIVNQKKSIVDHRLAKLYDLEIGECLALDEFIFEPGKHYLKKKSIPHLIELLDFLEKEKVMKIQIEGHVWGFYVDDTEEDRKEAKILSVNRAKNIYDYLIRNGISADRLSYIGYGISKPLPFTTRDPSLNRRVEIRVMEK